MTKIEIKDLSILFGPEKAKAKKMIKQGKSKQEILVVRCPAGNLDRAKR